MWKIIALRTKWVNLPLLVLGQDSKTAQEHQIATPLLPDTPYHYKDIALEYLGPEPPGYQVNEYNGCFHVHEELIFIK